MNSKLGSLLVKEGRDIAVSDADSHIAGLPHYQRLEREGYTAS